MRTDIQALARNIDNEILELSYQWNHVSSLIEAVGRAAFRNGGTNAKDAQEMVHLTERRRNISANRSKLIAVYEIYNWNRAWIVPGGHVHKDVSCHTLYADTTLILCPEVSGMTEDEIVAKAGERACTICYPSAPSEYFERKSQLMTRDEVEAEALRQQKEAARKAKESSKMTVFLPGEGKEGRNQTYGTVRGARNEALRSMDWYLFSNTFYSGRSSQPHYLNFEALVKAIAEREEKDVEDVKGELVGKALKKFRKENPGTEPVM